MEQECPICEGEGVVEMKIDHILYYLGFKYWARSRILGRMSIEELEEVQRHVDKQRKMRDHKGK